MLKKTTIPQPIRSSFDFLTDVTFHGMLREMNQTPSPQNAQAVAAVIPAPTAKGSLPLQKTEETLPKRTSRSVIVFLLLAFPPLAWFFMWTDKTYHHWFGKLLIASGLLALGITLLSFITIGTQVDQLYESLGVKHTNAALISMTNYLGAGFALLQIIFGVYLQSRMKTHTSLNQAERFMAVFLLTASLYVAFIPTFLIIQDIYPALSDLYAGTMY
jgi:hypothetical protein